MFCFVVIYCFKAKQVIFYLIEIFGYFQKVFWEFIFFFVENVNLFYFHKILLHFLGKIHILLCLQQKAFLGIFLKNLGI